jgi:hypothetical protein
MKKMGFAVWTVKDVAQERIRASEEGGSCTATMAVLSFDPLFELSMAALPKGPLFEFVSPLLCNPRSFLESQNRF